MITFIQAKLIFQFSFYNLTFAILSTFRGDMPLPTTPILPDPAAFSSGQPAAGYEYENAVNMLEGPLEFTRDQREVSRKLQLYPKH